MNSPAVHVAGLHFSYPSPLLDGSPVPALRGIDLDLAPGTFCALMGPVGAGKSTLCLALNGAVPHAVEGDLVGTVVVCGQNTRDVPMGRLSAQVGLVLEDVEAQLFSASVADEIAFGLEGLGLAPPEIEARIRSALELVGLSGLEQRVPRTLSGGQQKRLALASVLAMEPRLLILDEPTSGLDPRGRQAVLAAIDRLRRQAPHPSPPPPNPREREPRASYSPLWSLRGGVRGGSGMTVVMATQDAQAAARFADRVLVLREGQVALDGTPEQVFTQVDRLDAWGIDVPQLALLGQRIGGGTAQRFFTQAGLDPRKAGQVLVETGFAESAPGPAGTPPTPLRPDETRPRAQETHPGRGEPVIEVRALSHRYPGADEPALVGVDLEIRQGEWLAIVGINGSGKSTLIRHLNGLLKPTEGQVTVGRQDTRAARIGELARVVSYLPQNPGLLLFASTVRREIAYGPRQLGLRGTELDARVSDTLALVGLADYAEHPPAVLSYGLRRQVALASVLAMQAPVLALDEPATGLDRGAAGRLLDLIADRQRRGTTVVMITHDLRWVARYAQRVAVLSAGQLVACGPTRALLADLDLLAKAGLAPLPVTALAHAMNLASPLPLTVDELLARDARFARGARRAQGPQAAGPAGNARV